MNRATQTAHTHPGWSTTPQADGYVRGEGCGVVVLKTSADASADNDVVHALICGSATAKDRAPLRTGSGDFLGGLMKDSYANAEIDPAQCRSAPRDTAFPRASAAMPPKTDACAALCSFVEAHGSGDATMDVVEAQAISDVYAGSRGLLVGTVKTNIGHLDAAAGVASLLKTVLVLQHRQVRAPTPRGLSSNTMAPITSDCDAMRSLRTKWP